jgi:hypothetical protein
MATATHSPAGRVLAPCDRSVGQDAVSVARIEFTERLAQCLSQGDVRYNFLMRPRGALRRICGLTRRDHRHLMAPMRMNLLATTVLCVGLAALLAGCASAPSQQPLFRDVPGAAAPAGGTTAAGEVAAPVEPVPADAPEAAPPPAPERTEPSPQLIVTPDSSLEGRVASVNEAGRFVVIKFPLGRMPSLQSTLNVYRQGQKVGELKVTGPQKDDHIVADIHSGDCRVADVVRDR